MPNFKYAPVVVAAFAAAITAEIKAQPAFTAPAFKQPFKPSVRLDTGFETPQVLAAKKRLEGNATRNTVTGTTVECSLPTSLRISNSCGDTNLGNLTIGSNSPVYGSITIIVDVKGSP